MKVSLAVHRERKEQGFTIVELMLTLLVAAVLMAIGIPSFQTMIKSNRLTTTTNELIGAITFARSEAAKRGNTVHFRPASAASGSIIWIDDDTVSPDAPGDADDVEIRRWSSLPDGVTVLETNTYTFFKFVGSGEVDKAGTFTICDDRTGERGSVIELLQSGSVNRSSITCS